MLNSAAMSGRAECVRLLLNAGADTGTDAKDEVSLSSPMGDYNFVVSSVILMY